MYTVCPKNFRIFFVRNEDASNGISDLIYINKVALSSLKFHLQIL